MAAQEDVQQVLALFKRAIRSSGLSQKEVDRRIGVQPGYLSQVMIGRLDLKLKHLLRGLEAIDVDPAGFFSLALRAENGGAPRGSDLLRLMPAHEAEPQEPSLMGLSDDHLERLVARALAEELKPDPAILS